MCLLTQAIRMRVGVCVCVHLCIRESERENGVERDRVCGEVRMKSNIFPYEKFELSWRCGEHSVISKPS